MNDICGRPFSTLSASADLQSSLESRLRQQLGTDGSTIFALTWKQKATPQGRSYSQLAASVRPTNETGFSSWPTVTTQDNNQVAGVGAAKANPKRGTTLGGAVRLVPWVTPSARDWKDTKGMSTGATNRDGSKRNRVDQLPRQVFNLLPASTENEGLSRLNPRFSLWLMGFPTTWTSSGEQVTPLSRKSRLK